MRLVGEGLASVRGERMVLRNVNFVVSPGRALLLQGPNGSGKTTLLRVIAGLLGLMAGRLRLLDDDDRPMTDERRDRALHFVGHQDMVRAQLRVVETLRFHAAMLGADARAVDAALDAWGLAASADISAGLLSAGQRRRLSLARLSLQHRKLWLLDEPLVAIDASTRARLAAACQSHLQGGGLIVAASHEPFLADARTLTLGERP